MQRPQGLTRELMAMRVAQEFEDGMTVNLGIGLPTLVSSFLPEGRRVTLQSENGILGFGGISDGDFDQDLINAGGQPITLLPGASFCDSATSFGMIRGGHIDIAVLGGLQMSETGDLANWFVPARGGGSVGGAMDLAVGARKLIVVMEHTTREGEARILRECTYPLTGQGCVDLVVTDLAVIDVTPDGLVLREVAPGVTSEQVAALTDAPLRVPNSVAEMRL
ncbi:MAG: 3-oxoacid CoA-transferase subunit B [Dehalococcoidia bacterium]|nr:3-oxoacid CoA-transferase subunit B [Dehalococcoidia bacterium]